MPVGRPRWGEPRARFSASLETHLCFTSTLENVITGRTGINPGTADGGMDFVVRWNPFAPGGNPQGYRGPGHFSGTPTYLYGQCKHYKLGHNLGRPVIDGLAGSLQTLQGYGGTVRVRAVRRALLAWGWAPNAPHYRAFATTARFPQDWQHTDYPDVLKMDGEHIAQSLLHGAAANDWPSCKTHLEGLRQASAKVTVATNLPPP